MPLLRYLLFIILTFSFTIANGDISTTGDTIYEDGNLAENWSIYDTTPTGATISNIFDLDSNSNVIELSGDGKQNGFILGYFNNNHVNAWDNTTQKVISWDAKFSEPVSVFIAIQSTQGFRYLYYTDTETDFGILGANQNYIHHGIGSNLRNGAWHTVTRDLEADLQDFEPTNQIVSVNGFLIRGSGRVDNIKMESDGLQISSVEAINIKENSVSIEWSLNEVATGQVEYGTDTHYGQLSTKEASFNYSTHIQYISNLLPNTTYHYRVISESVDGQQIISEDKTFKTTGTGFQADAIEAINIKENSVSIKWSLNEVATGQVEYGTDTHYGQLSTKEVSFNYSTHIQYISNLLPNTTYHYRVISENVDGQQIISGDNVFKTTGSASLDTQAPTITLTGESNIELTKGSTYTELGATATDNIDTNVAVTISGSVDTHTVGTYTVTYTAIDIAENQATTIRTVVVKADENSQNIPIPAVPERTVPSPTLLNNIGDIKINASHPDHNDWKVHTEYGSIVENHFGSGKGAIKLNQDHNDLHWVTNYNLAKNINLDTYYTVSWKQQASNANNPMTTTISFVINGTRGMPANYSALVTTNDGDVQTFYAVIKFNSKQWERYSPHNIGVEMANYPKSHQNGVTNATNTGEGSAYVGDFKIYEGKQIPAPLRQNKAFGGSAGRVKISETGAWNIDGKDVFPMMLYTSAGRYRNNETENLSERYPEIVAHGFDGVNNGGFVSGNETETWNQHLNSKAVKDNNIWFAVQLRSHLAKGEHLDWLDISLKRFQDLNLMNHVKMWSIDNEIYTKDFPFWNEVKAIIDKYDPKGEIPFVMLDGNKLLGDNYPMVNQTGAYLEFARDGALFEGAPESKGEVLISQAFSGEHTASAGLIQINPGSDEDLFAGILFGGIASGGTQMHHWEDNANNDFGGDYDTRMALKAWYAELPNYRADIEKMLEKGIIQGKTFTNFTLDSADARFTFGTKITSDRLAYLIIAANTLDNNTLTSTISGLHYETSGRLINVLTGQLEGTLSGNSVNIDVPGNGYKILFIEPSDKYAYSE